jgi:hypothetical protein
MGNPPNTLSPPPLLLSTLEDEGRLAQPIISFTSMDDLCDPYFIVNYEIDRPVVTDSYTKQTRLRGISKLLDVSTRSTPKWVLL